MSKHGEPVARSGDYWLVTRLPQGEVFVTMPTGLSPEQRERVWQAVKRIAEDPERGVQDL